MAEYAESKMAFFKFEETNWLELSRRIFTIESLKVILEFSKFWKIVFENPTIGVQRLLNSKLDGSVIHNYKFRIDGQNIDWLKLGESA